MGSKWPPSPLICGPRLILVSASMRELIKPHKKAIETLTPLDYERLQSITYLYEFDREVQ